jgi:hypothetical protein
MKKSLSPEAKKIMFRIQELLKEVFKEIGELKEKKNQAKIELERMEEIEERIEENYELSKYNENDDWEYLLPLQDTNRIVEIIKDRSSEEIIKAIKENRIEYIKSSREQHIHAEMKIINELCKSNKRQFEYIGITKLSCCPFWTAISIVNPTQKKSCVRGTHGSTYGEWTVPDDFPDQEELYYPTKN